MRYWAEAPPHQAMVGSSQHVGLDLATLEEVTIPGMEYVEVDFGVVLEPPAGHWLMMTSRSSTFKRWGIILTNGVGVIDPAYCGANDTVKGLFYNCNPEDVTIPKGTRLVQIIPMPLKFDQVWHYPHKPSAEDRGGIGSTG